MKKKKKSHYIRWCWKKFCIVFFNKKHVARDSVALIIAILILGTMVGASWYQKKKIKEGKAVDTSTNQGQVITPIGEPFAEETFIEKQQKKVRDVQSKTDTSFWIWYRNSWYGFSLKYSSDWADPIVKKAPIGALWEQKVQFRPLKNDEENPFEGFDVVIYNIAKVKELSNIDEYPKIKNEELIGNDDCATVKDHFLETDEYPAEEIYIPADDSCFDPTLFFSNIRDNYIYAIAPKIKDGTGFTGDTVDEIIQYMPDFFSVVKSYEFIDIQRPKKTSSPKIKAPLPAAFKVSGGRRVCDKKNDHPSKSNQHKGKHMDMECCLDPDEYPNPNCYYPPEKYGKYL